MNNKAVAESTIFAKDVLKGLSSRPKALSSKYFYDDEGSRLFQEIMELPEYYLTACEYEIFEIQSDEILRELDSGTGSLDIIELGAGDGTKTAVLIEHFLSRDIELTFSPIDISQQALDDLTSRFEDQFPGLKMAPRCGDYFEILHSLLSQQAGQRVVMFLGSNIGNFDREAATAFFRHLASEMNPGDLLFIGFDLQKDPRVIVPAYDDAAGVTAAFNLNLLRRINRELGGNFDLSKFSHYANYRPIEGSARSYLISREDQDVHIESLGRTFHFDQWEAVFVEISQKYSLRLIDELASSAGFEVKRNFFDSRKYYCNSLWKLQS